MSNRTVRKFKFTKALVEAIPIPSREDCGTAGYIWWYDTLQPGLRVKVTPSGTKIFVWAYRNEAGRQKKLKLGRFGAITVEQARDAYRTHAGKLANGADPQAERVKARLAHDMAELFDLYLDQHIRPPGVTQTIAAAERALIHAKKHLGRFLVTEIRKPDVMRARDTLRHRPGLQNIFTNYVRAAINWGRERGYFPDDRFNPAAAIAQNPSTPRKRDITQAEFRRIGQAIMDMLADNKNDPSRLLAMWFCALTGCRPVEAIRIRPEYVNDEAGTITLPPNQHKTGRKTGEPRVWFITPEIQEVLDRAKLVRQLRNQHDYLFPRRNRPAERSWYSRAWEAICRRAKVRDIVLYNFRSAVVVTSVDELGLNESESMDLTGHKDRRVWDTHYRISRDRTTRKNTGALTRNIAHKLFGEAPPDAPLSEASNVVPFKRPI